MKAHIPVSSINDDTEQRFATFVRSAIFSLERARKKSQPQKRVAEELGMSFRTLQEWLGGAHYTQLRKRGAGPDLFGRG